MHAIKQQSCSNAARKMLQRWYSILFYSNAPEVMNALMTSFEDKINDVMFFIDMCKLFKALKATQVEL